MTEIHTVHAVSKNFLNIHFNIILPFMAISELANYVTRAHNGTQRDFLAHVIHCCLMFYIFCLTSVSVL